MECWLFCKQVSVHACLSDIGNINCNKLSSQWFGPICVQSSGHIGHRQTVALLKLCPYSVAGKIEFQNSLLWKASLEFM